MMAIARFSKGLRRGSTKSETYSTLKTAKFGRVQIIKDRVTDIANPQTTAQMRQRVIFGTVTQAAKMMAQLIEISQEGITDRNFARQQFVSENVKFLQSVAGRRVGLNRHYLAAYAPKGNAQLIPNSYIVSNGSLTVPSVLVPNTTDGDGSFDDAKFANVGALPGIPFGDYTPAKLWEILFGLLPGDQVSFPQIYGDGEVQTLSSASGEIIDKTLETAFVCPRIVLRSVAPTSTITISAETTIDQVRQAMGICVDEESSWMPLAENILDHITIDDTADDTLVLGIYDTYDAVFGVNNDDHLRAIGCILSRKDESGKWQYSKSQLCCVWNFIGENSGKDYFGFTLENAIATYLPSTTQDANGNFLQRGGNSDIIPASFT